MIKYSVRIVFMDEHFNNSVDGIDCLELVPLKQAQKAFKNVCANPNKWFDYCPLQKSNPNFYVAIESFRNIGDEEWQYENTIAIKEFRR